MPDQVRVEDLEAFRVFRAALHKFALIAEQTMTSSQAHIDRVHSWLESDQRIFWAAQLKKRNEAVVEAREAVRQKKLYKDSTGRIPSAIEEQKHLQRCLQAVAQAEEKILAVKKWIPRLEKETELYRSGVARLHKAVGGDLPRAIALLDRLAGSLEDYVQLEAPSMATPEGAAPSESAETMSRGGETEPPPAATPMEKPQANPAAPDQAPPTPEGTHVPDGK